MTYTLKTFNELNNIELYEILQLRSEIFVVEQNCIYNDLDGLDIKGDHLFQKEDNKIVSYVRILKPGSRFSLASIGRVVTHKEYRHRGFSSAIMKHAISYLQNEMNTHQIKISAQKYLRKFYEDLGFIVVSDEYLEDGIPHYGMLLTKNEIN
jgi:ElaA protein